MAITSQNLTVFLLSTVTLLAAHGLGHADEKDALLSTLHDFDAASGYFDAQGMSEADRFDRGPDACTAIVDQLQQLGVPPTHMVLGYMNKEWPFKKAAERCERYGRYRLVVQATQVLADAAAIWSIVEPMTDDDRDAVRFGQEGIKAGTLCAESLAALAAQGLPMDEVLTIAHHGTMTPAEGHARCKVMVAKATKLHSLAAAAAAERNRIERERFTRHGVAGDRLDLLMTYETWTLKGCMESSDPKLLAKARVLMRFGENANATVRQRKITFKGNKKVSDQERTLPNWSHTDAACK